MKDNNEIPANEFFRNLMVCVFNASHDAHWQHDWLGFKTHGEWMELFLDYFRSTLPATEFSVNFAALEKVSEAIRPRLGDTVKDSETGDTVGVIVGHAVVAKTGEDKLYGRFEVRKPDGSSVYLYEAEGLFRAITMEEPHAITYTEKG